MNDQRTIIMTLLRSSPFGRALGLFSIKSPLTYFLGWWWNELKNYIDF